MFYHDLAGELDRASRLGCKEMRLFLLSQASRLRMMQGPAQEGVFIEGSKALVDSLEEMGHRQRKGEILRPDF